MSGQRGVLSCANARGAGGFAYLPHSRGGLRMRSTESDMMLATDESLLERMAEGEVAAFAELYDRYSARVLGLLIKMLGRRDDAEDVAQETFWQVWNHARTYDSSRASPAAWLFMIARSRGCDALRRGRPHANEAAWVEPFTSADVWEALERDEACHRLSQALSQIPEVQRTAVQLAFYGGLSHTEIAGIQNVPLGTVKTRIRLAMTRLRVLLGEPEKVASS